MAASSRSRSVASLSPRTPVSGATQAPASARRIASRAAGQLDLLQCEFVGRLQTPSPTTMSEMDSHSSTTSSDRHCMHGDGPGMSVGEAVEEHYFSPTNNSPAAGSGANGSPAASGTLQAAHVCGGYPGDYRTSSRQGGVGFFAFPIRSSHCDLR